MKKFLLIFMMLSLSLVTVANVTKNSVEVKANPNLFDLYCDSPRFMYREDTLGDLQRLDCTFRILDAGLDLEEVNNISVNLVEVDFEGNFIQVIETIDTNYERIDNTISEFETSVFIGDATAFHYVDLSVYSGEIIEVSYVYNFTTSTVLNNDETVGAIEWIYDNENEQIVIFPNLQNDSDTLGIVIRKYDSQEYTFNYINDLSFIDKDKVFYQFRYNGLILSNGMIVKTPTYEPNTDTVGYSIDFGDYYFTDDSLDFDDLTKYTYLGDDKYFLLHYEADPNVVETLYIKFYDVKNGTIEEIITTDDIFTYQGDNTIEDYRSFIPINLNTGEIPALAKGFGTIENDIPANIRTFNLSEGVYIVTLENGSGDLLDYSDYVFINFDSNFIPFNIRFLYDNLDLSVSQRVDFNRPSENMNSYFETTEAIDYGNNYDYSTDINNSTDFLYISYKALNTLDTGDVVSFGWTFEPVSLPLGIDKTLYSATITEQYTISTGVSTDQQVRNIIDYMGLGDNTGLLFVSIIFLLILNLVLVFVIKGTAYIVYVIVNGVGMVLLSVLGLLSIWVGIGVGVILMISLILASNVTRSDEL